MPTCPSCGGRGTGTLASRTPAPRPRRRDPRPRASRDRQDVDLSVAAQLRALREHAERNNYVVVREYVDEAESGRVADRPQFRQMLDAASADNAPFEEILVWKFSRFTRKREHAVAFKSMLRRRGVRVVSITEHADDSPTGKLMEAIIESVDEFYSENLAQDVVRGMRESASGGFFLASRAPFGYKRVKVQDGGKERPTLEVDPDAAPIVREVFEQALRGQGLKEICRDLNERGVTNRGRRWQKNSIHYLLTNEAYTGTAVWGKTSRVGKTPDPVRVEGAWEPLVTKELFDGVREALRSRAPSIQRPARVGSKFLLSGLLRCGLCGKAYVGQGAKSGQYGYYVCATLQREGAGMCEARYLNAERAEGFVVDKIRERILTDETIIELVTLRGRRDRRAGGRTGREAAHDRGGARRCAQPADEALRGPGDDGTHDAGALAPYPRAAPARGPVRRCARGRGAAAGGASRGAADLG